jgi:hypothetical protein
LKASRWRDLQIEALLVKTGFEVDVSPQGAVAMRVIDPAILNGTMPSNGRGPLERIERYLPRRYSNAAFFSLSVKRANLCSANDSLCHG